MVNSRIPGVTPSDNLALGLSSVWACVRVLVQSGSTLPLEVVKREEDGSVSTLPRTDPVVRILQSPNAYMNGLQFAAAMWACRVMWGNAYAVVTRSNGRLISLQPIHPAHVTVERKGGRLVYRIGESKVIQQSDMLHWRGWSPDGTIGLSTLDAMKGTLSVSIASENKAAAAFSGVPTGFLKTDALPNDAQRDDIMSHYSGIGEDSSIWLLPGGMDFQNIGLPPDTLQMIETRQFQVAEVCRFFGVPSVLVEGAASNSAAWPASYEQQMLSFLQLTLRPYMEELEAALRSTLAPNRPTLDIRHNTSDLLRTDSQSRASYYSTMIQAGVMTINEARSREGLPPVDGGDEPRAQLGIGNINEEDATNAD
jgi:HK97 family phage portal protein